MRYIRRRPIRLELLELLIAISLLGLLVLGSVAAVAQPLQLPATPGPFIRIDNGAHAAGTVARSGRCSAPIIGVSVESSSRRHLR